MRPTESPTAPRRRALPSAHGLATLTALLTVVSIVAVLAAPAAGAAATTLTLDPKASHVTFTLEATLHTVGGKFRVVEGSIAFDSKSGDASGRVVVDAASGDTDNPRRDRDMHGKVLESEKYPRAVFTPTHVEGDLPADGATKRITLAGKLSLHGTSHPVEIPARVTRHGSRVTAEGDLTVPYVEWGLEDPSKFMLRVAKEVTVHLTAVGTLKAP